MATMKPKGDADAGRFNKAVAKLKRPKRSADAAAGAAVVKKRLAATAATTKNAASKKASDAKTPVSYSTKKNETNYSSKVQKKLKSKFGK